MRPIDADALRNAMYHEAFETDTDMQRWDSGCWIRYKLFEKVLENMPSEEPEQKKGKWRPVQIGKWHGFECTCCKINRDVRDVPCSNNGIPQWKYCPDCGAKLEVE